MTRRIALGVVGFAIFCFPGAVRGQRSSNQWTASGGTGLGLENGTYGTFGAVGQSRFAHIGFAVAPNLIVSAELQNWSGQPDPEHTDVLNFKLVGARWYPFQTHGWFVNGAVGRVDVSTSDVLGHASGAFNGNSLATSFGTGWDIPLVWRLSLTPSLTTSGTAGSSIDDRSCYTSYSGSGASTTTCSTAKSGRSFSLMQLGLGLTLH